MRLPPASAIFASSSGAPAITAGKFIISARPSTRSRARIPARSASESGARGDSNGLAGTHDGSEHEHVDRQPLAARRGTSARRRRRARWRARADRTRSSVVPRATSTRASSPTHQLGRLDVHVRVDEPGGEPAPAPVDALAALVRADAGEPPVGDRDVALEPLPRERAEDPRALDHDVRLRLATGDGQQAGGRQGSCMRGP